MGNFISSLEYLKKALLLEEHMDIAPNTSRVIRGNLAITFQQLDSFRLAEQMYHEARQFGAGAGLYRNMATLYFTEDKNELGFTYLDSAYTLALEQKNYVLMASIHMVYAKMYIQQKKPFSIIESELAQAREFIDMINVEFLETDYWANYGLFAQYQQKYPLARKSYLLALKGARELGENQDEAQYYKSLASIDSLMGNMASAYQYHQRYHHLTDSLKSLKQQEAIDNFTLELELNESQQKQELIAQDLILSKKISQNRLLLLWGAIALLLVVSGALLIIYRQRNRIEEISARIDKQNVRLKDLIQERQLILQLITHDLRTPLNHILYNAAHLTHQVKEDLMEKEDSLDNLNEIKGSAKDISMLANQILAYEPAQLHGEHAELSPIDLNEQLQITVKNHQAKAARKGITLSLDQLSKPAVSITNPQALQLILDNLVSNAIKYSPPQSQVKISLQEEADAYRLQIKDEGPGFEQSDFAKMFNRFQTLSAKPTGGEKALGMGLYLVKKLSDSIDAMLEIDNHPDGGAVGRLSFGKARA